MGIVGEGTPVRKTIPQPVSARPVCVEKGALIGFPVAPLVRNHAHFLSSQPRGRR